MMESLQAINHMSEELYNMTRGKLCIGRTEAQTLRLVLDDMLAQLDQIMDEITIAENEIDGDEQYGLQSYIPDEPPGHWEPDGWYL